MATVRTSPLVNGLSGMLGQSIVFKNLRGKTIATKAPQPPQRQSAQQKQNRSKFRDATNWAQNILLDADKKAYYQKKAKKLKLPNAYTAAITDYMRKPKLISYTSHDNTITCHVSKKDFQLKKVEVVIRKEEGDEVRVITTQGNDWYFKLTMEEVNNARVRVADAADNNYLIEVIQL